MKKYIKNIGVIIYTNQLKKAIELLDYKRKQLCIIGIEYEKTIECFLISLKVWLYEINIAVIKFVFRLQNI